MAIFNGSSQNWPQKKRLLWCAFKLYTFYIRHIDGIILSLASSFSIPSGQIWNIFDVPCNFFFLFRHFIPIRLKFMIPASVQKQWEYALYQDDLV
jgi:hypothetical protein